MHESDKMVEASYRYCRRICRRAGSNFLAGFFLLPKHKRRAMWALYAFMRHSDDLVDLPSQSPSEALAAWRAAVQWALHEGERDERRGAMAHISPLPLGEGPGVRAAGESQAAHTSTCPHPNPLPKGEGTDISPRPLVGEGPGVRAARDLQIAHTSNSPHPCPLPKGEGTRILPALADAVRQFGIPHEHLFAVLDGMEMDLRRPSYQTFAELEEYCHRVASAVGLACIHIWGFDGPAALEPARRAGVALQLTNILRDLGEDAAAGRIYLPLEDFSSAGYSVDELRRGVANDGFLRLMRLEIARARRYYDTAEELMDHLSRDGRRIHGVLMDTYRRLLEKIERSPAEVLRHRIRLGRFEKLCIVARHALP
jgi:phytoene synthase